MSKKETIRNEIKDQCVTYGMGMCWFLNNTQTRKEQIETCKACKGLKEEGHDYVVAIIT